MDFDSLKPIRGTSVNNEYSDKKNYTEKENLDVKTTDVSKDLSNTIQEKAKAADSSAQEQGKYNESDLYKGENFQKKMEQAISEANKMLKPANKSFSYSVHEGTKKIMIQIKDNDTGEVLKEIPSEENLDMVAKMRELAGIVIDEKR